MDWWWVRVVVVGGLAWAFDGFGLRERFVHGDESERLAEAIRVAIRDGMRGSPAVRGLLMELARVVMAEAEGLGVDAGSAAVGGVGEGVGDDGGVGGGVDDGGGVGGVDAGVAGGGVVEPERVPLERLRLGGAATSDGGLVSPARIVGPRVLSTGRDVGRDVGRDAGRDVGRDVGSGAGVPEIDLGLVARRCRLKAESCRFFIERRLHEGDASRDAEFAGRINAMIAEAKSMPSCFLWVFWKEAKQPSDDELRLIGDCYDALADAALLCERTGERGSGFDEDEVESAFALLAEASSALRIAIGWTWLSSPDVDQDESHLWLRRETASRMIYVRRHMMLDDPAEPERAPGVRAEVARIVGAADRRRKGEKQVEALLNKARYHAKKLADASEPDEHDCAKVNQAVGELGMLGLRASDARIVGVRELLEGISFPESVPKHAWLVSKDAGVAAADGDDEEEDEGRAWSAGVLSVRELLRGGRVVIVGGEPRQRAIDRISEAFELDGVDWVHLSEHGTGAGMEAPIHREQTRLVLVLIKLTGHLHAEQARAMAAEAGRPCVMMPAGYNPEQIAAQVLKQADERLEQWAPAGG